MTNLALLAISVALAVMSGGAFSIDRQLARIRNRTTSIPNGRNHAAA